MLCERRVTGKEEKKLHAWFILWFIALLIYAALDAFLVKTGVGKPPLPNLA